MALAAYNGEEFIREQIDSILSQTVQDFELVAVDDCSSDSTWSVLQEFARKDKRIRAYKNQENLGFKKNFEKALSLCQGDYVALCDQDDIWLPNHLEALYARLGQKSLVCGNSELINKDGSSMGRTLFEEQRFSYLGGSYLPMLVLRGCKGQGASMLLRGTFAKKAMPVPQGVYAHDHWLAAAACVDGGMEYFDQVVTKYRLHGKNETTQKRAEFLRTLLGQFFGGGIKTCAPALCAALRERYGGGEDLLQISGVVQNIMARKIRARDLRFLWNRYYDIGGKKSRRDFVLSLACWLRWKEAV